MNIRWFSDRQKHRSVKLLVLLLLLGLLGAIAPSMAQQISPNTNSALTNSPLVDIHRINPRILLDIRYATKNNFTHQVLYPQARCLLQATVAKHLSQVQADLEHEGLGLKVYDCYRPISVQKVMWRLVPDERYVANPAQGSRHNRGSAVDLTLVDRLGNDLEMPTGFDDFSERAHIGYPGASATARQNRQRLEQAMRKRAFIPLKTEWWHFDAQNWHQYPILDIAM